MTSTSVAWASRFLRSQGVGTMDWPAKAVGSSGSGGGAQAGGSVPRWWALSLRGLPTPLRGESSGVLYKECAMALVCSPEASMPGSTRSSSGASWLGNTGMPSRSSARASSSSYSTVGWLRHGRGRVHMAQRPSRAHLVRISRVPSEISRNLAASTTSRKAAPSASADVNTASWSTYTMARSATSCRFWASRSAFVDTPEVPRDVGTRSRVGDISGDSGGDTVSRSSRASSTSFDVTYFWIPDLSSTHFPTASFPLDDRLVELPLLTPTGSIATLGEVTRESPLLLDAARRNCGSQCSPFCSCRW
mmetsp:Transcript_94763/g.253480  ORF Transcript_94763/g.253480 Transcript_94763/m.253480 type:complete len:305 (+) Transcript_94763:1099-2013(+)